MGGYATSDRRSEHILRCRQQAADGGDDGGSAARQRSARERWTPPMTRHGGNTWRKEINRAEDEVMTMCSAVLTVVTAAECAEE